MDNAPHPKTSSFLALAALVLPVLGLLALLGWTLGNRHLRTSYGLAIEGYDPRDLLRGQYLQFRYVRPDDIAQAWGNGTVICLEGQGKDPRARIKNGPDCRDYVTNGSGRFYLPENRANAVESLLQNGKHRFSVRAYAEAGTLVPTDLLIDGKPWNEVLDADEQTHQNNRR